MPSARRLARETLVLTAGNFVGLAVGLVGTVLVTRALGPAGRGVYSWLLTLATIGVQLALLAPPQAVRALVDRDAGGRLPATLGAICLAGSCLSLPLAAYAYLDPALGPAARPVLLGAWLSVPLTAVGIALFALLQIEGRAGPILLVQIAPRAAQLLAILALWAWSALDLQAAVWLVPATAAMALVLTLALLRPAGLDPRPDPALARELAGQLGFVWVSALAVFCVPRASLLVLGASASADTVGQYGLALALQETALAAPFALGGVLVSHVSRVGAPDRRAAVGAILRIAALAGLVGIVAALLVPLLVPLVFGQAFGPAASIFQELLLAVWLATLFQACQPVLIAAAHPVGIVAPALFGLAAAVVVALLAVPRLGIDGAVLSNVAGFAALAGSALWLASRPAALAAARPR